MVMLGQSQKTHWSWCGRGVASQVQILNVRGVIPQARVSMSGIDPSGTGVDVVPHEDPCVRVVPGSRPVGTAGLAGAIGAQLQLSQQRV